MWALKLFKLALSHKICYQYPDRMEQRPVYKYWSLRILRCKKESFDELNLQKFRWKHTFCLQAEFVWYLCWLHVTKLQQFAMLPTYTATEKTADLELRSPTSCHKFSRRRHHDSSVKWKSSNELLELTNNNKIYTFTVEHNNVYYSL
jgi:hypothetical protein